MPKNWYIKFLIPRTVYFNKLESFISFMKMLMLLVITVLGLLSFYIARKFTVPLKNMEKNIIKFGKGDFGVTLSIDEDDDEIGHLKKMVEVMFAQIRALIKANEVKKEEQHKAEFEVLHAQINPHFIYNTLDSISWMAKMNGHKDIEDIVFAMSKFFKISLHNGEKYIKVEEEIDLVKSYVAIQKIRYPEKFDVVFNIEEEIMDCEIIKIILQPFVENAIKHAFIKRNKGGLIVINGFRDGIFLIFEVVDNGDGFDTSILKDSSKIHVGIRNTTKRIGFEYGEEECGVFFESELGKGTKVTIKVKCYEEMF